MRRSESLMYSTQLEQLRELAASVAGIPGSVAEVGVFNGGSAVVISNALPDRRLYLYDTFEGLHKPRLLDGVELEPGMFKADSIDAVHKMLPDAIIIVGPFSKHTVPDCWDSDGFAFVHIDVKLYEPTCAALDTFTKLVVPGGIIVVNSATLPGATQAVRDWLDRGLMPSSWCSWPESGGFIIRKPTLAELGKQTLLGVE